MNKKELQDKLTFQIERQKRIEDIKPLGKLNARKLEECKAEVARLREELANG